MMEIWTEKYRPSNFKSFVGHKAILERIRAMIKVHNIPNLLFAGPSGVGKSTTALIIANELYGENWRESFLELNASDDRGINVVRGVIKDFARTRPIESVPFKIAFLDECDSLTREAQQALRRTMEVFSDNVRFILSCNYSSKIIEPIQSRCSIFRFKQLDTDSIREVAKNISSKEGLILNNKAVDAICDISNGDVRKAINILQSSASLNKVITEDLIYSIASAARPKEIKELLETALVGDFIKSRETLLDVMLKHGLSGLDLIKFIQKEILSLGINEEKKLRLIERCGEIEFRLVEGADEFVQLESLLASFVLLGK